MRHPDTIIVGSGVSILKEPCGEYVDRFDRVIRFNGCQRGLDSLSDYAGSKTDLLVCNSSIDSLNNLLELQQLKCRHFLLYDPSRGARASHDRMRRHLHKAGVRYTSRSKTALMGEGGPLPYFSWPTSGYVMINKVLAEKERVCIHGFDMVDDLTWCGNEDHTGYHFYDPSISSKYFYHDLREEAEKIRGLIAEGRVVELKTFAGKANRISR